MEPAKVCCLHRGRGVGCDRTTVSSAAATEGGDNVFGLLKVDRRSAVRKPEPRSRQRLFCRWHSRRNPDPSSQDRGIEGHLTNVDGTLQEFAWRSAADRQAAWRGQRSGGQRAKTKRPGAG